MRLISSKEDLLFAVQTAQRAVSLKSPLPILSGIKFETQDDLLITTATDLEVGIKCSVKASVFEQGSAVLPAKYISELIRRLPDIPILFNSDPATGSMTIKYGESETNINGFPVEEFPDVSLPSCDNNFDIKENIFRDAIRQIIFAVGTDENRPVFTGVMLEVKNGQMQMVATDTHRLAWRKVDLDNYNSSDITVIVPGKTLNELSRIIGRPEQSVQVKITENQVLFSSENLSFISRLINGKFPHYRQVIPKELVAKVRLKTRELSEATERAALLATEGSSAIKLDIQDNILVISANAVAGRVYEEIPAYYEGEPMQVAFNAYYLSELLKAIGNEEIDIEFAGPLSPGIFRPVGDEGYFSLLLPVRIKEE
ncbi:MAG: DNA polymerase III subunit beta [Pelotomaculum sp. PtaB.Bin013]|uniref:Beta sliding clamp n=1 Tax=Pelotomaculum isophthalicicum JI TaxID=947010 RepID=A0A9X4GYG0_9FIRM|nr:DNA polymerase III subunit beta [Pelotomaculum isophthalicicum]MDF9407747.1 DNA polymerase III subunit beta [Pelotomaculum isophthalicicum JI]OPX87614.1 MAG: DNA polymerase III subunit beta [Pelotomaculum sp. PtaB.Bin013]